MAAEPSHGDLGGVGLLETPTARMMPDGTVSFGFAVTGGPYRHAVIGFQPMPWLEMTLRETMQPAPDHLPATMESGVSIKARLLSESGWLPAVALGLRDFAGGRTAAEYVVLGKRWYDFDVSLGLGWGRLGEAGYLPNPLRPIGGRYGRDRDPIIAPAGPGSWFTGNRVALFGGIAWETPIPDLTFKLELSADRLRLDRWENQELRAGQPVNAGVVWQPWPWLDLGAGLEHGRTIVVRASVLLDPAADIWPRPPLRDLPPPPAAAVVNGSRAITWIDPTQGVGAAYPPGMVVGQTLRAMAARAPPGIEEVTVVAASHGLDGVAASAMTSELRRANHGYSSGPEIRQSGRLEPGAAVSESAGQLDGWRPGNSPAWRVLVAPRLEQSPFESTTPIVFRASVGVASELNLTDGLIFGHSARFTPAANLDLLDTSLIRQVLRPPAQRPVRSDLADYVAATRLATAETLQMSWLANPTPSWQTRLSIGWLEEMYGGASVEVLYRPWRSRWALGAEIDPVGKRLPGNTLWLRPDTETISAMASLYYESDDGCVNGALHAGRYLGGDLGSTLEVMRNFDAGIRIGAYFTGTTGAERLGFNFPQNRDRFDGGLHLSVPLGALPLILTVESRAELIWRTLGRDSGQRLDAPLRLEPLTRTTGYGPLSGSWEQR
ncbi:MAG: YjbH domain-containing protein [Rhodospirillaceae bacterium]